jgi:site-specific recombinase XerD
VPATRFHHLWVITSQEYSDSLTGYKDGSKARKLNSLKSLFTFAHDLGYTPMNVGKALKPPKVKSELAQRILSEEQAIRMISLEDNPRNHAMLRLMYHCSKLPLEADVRGKRTQRDSNPRPTVPKTDALIH